MQWIGGGGHNGYGSGDELPEIVRVEPVLSKVAGLLINYNTPETLITGGGSAMVPLTRCSQVEETISNYWCDGLRRVTPILC